MVNLKSYSGKCPLLRVFAVTVRKNMLSAFGRWKKMHWRFLAWLPLVAKPTNLCQDGVPSMVRKKEQNCICTMVYSMSVLD
jgi:hypothetical protein